MRAICILIVISVPFLGGCGDSNDCLESFDLDCTPLYEPTFENVHSITFSGKCSLGGTSCHGTSGNKGGVSFSSDLDTAHENLINGGRIDLVQPECSVLLQRMMSEISTRVMPPGSPLPDAELCAVRQWIAAGAPR